MIPLRKELLTVLHKHGLPLDFLQAPYPTWTRWINDLKCVLGYACIRKEILHILMGHRGSDADADVDEISEKGIKP